MEIERLNSALVILETMVIQAALLLSNKSRLYLLLIAVLAENIHLITDSNQTNDRFPLAHLVKAENKPDAENKDDDESDSDDDDYSDIDEDDSDIDEEESSDDDEDEGNQPRTNGDGRNDDDDSDEDSDDEDEDDEDDEDEEEDDEDDDEVQPPWKKKT